MNTWHSVHGPDGQVLFDRMLFVRSSRSRLRGLLGRQSLPAGEGLALRQKSIHLFFMRMPLDIVFCDANMEIVRIVPELRPWRTAGARRAHYALEIGAGEAERLGLHEGMALKAEPAFERRARRLAVSPLTKA
jgi:uncharacterized membrane protein (UPF0127 family)